MSHVFHVIKDPVHGTLQFSSIEDKWIKPFIDSPHFQRLRHIKQLGMGDYIFPGAVHTRFNHSIGCAYIGSQIANKIGLSDEERQLVMIACLLHDIGHGPFSHAFEDVFYQKSIRHEHWTPHFLASFNNSEFFEKYSQLNPRYSLTEEKFHQIANMIMHQEKNKTVLADIVSSQLDADRLDYLLRDSHFCGVKYGEYDLRWMLHCMTIIQYHGKERLGITHKGIGVVEHYLMARRLMMRNIYHAHKKLAIEFVLVQLLTYLATHIETEFNYLLKTGLGKILMAINAFNQQAKDKKQCPERLNAFLAQHFPLYQSLCDYDIFSVVRDLAEQKDQGPATAMAACIQFRRIPKIYHLELANSSTAQAVLAEFKLRHQQKYADWQIGLIMSPHQSYSMEEPILVENELKLVRPIDQYSIMLNAIADQYEHVLFLCVDQSIIEDTEVRILLNHLQQQTLQVNYGS